MTRKTTKNGRSAPSSYTASRKGWLSSSLSRAVLRFGLLVGIWGFIGVTAVVGWYALSLPRLIDTAAMTRKPSITILAEDGSVVARYGEITGALVTVQQLPPTLINAVLAVEDRRFYSHFGIDPIGLTRAMFVNFTRGRLVQGGSTITQQLAKNLFLSAERSMNRKVQEALLALWLEWKFSKDEILTAYLNRVYLGAGAYGVDAAARIYFNKPATQLNLRESAIIAGLLRAPSRYSPLNNPKLSEERAKTVLGTMVDAGMISQAEAAKVFAKSTTSTKVSAGTSDYGRYFADWVLDEVRGYIGTDHGDIVVQTTLRPQIQRGAEVVLDAQLAQAAKDKKNVGEAAAVVLSSDGAIRAMVGGRDWGDSQFNRATQALRQPGSSFKPVIYLTALLNGYQPDTQVEDAPISIGNYSPDNYTKDFKGWVPLSEALAQSLNTVAVRMLQDVGLPAAFSTARKLGLPTPKDSGLSYALGTSEVSLLQLTTAYTIIQNGGQSVRPYGIHMIRGQDGRLIWRRLAAKPDQVIPAERIAALVEMMKGVPLYGTGQAARLGDRPMAGKTGTSQSFRDAWFMGFTADYVGGVWMGNDDNSSMKKVTGGGYPARAWRGMMEAAEAGLPLASLPTDGLYNSYASGGYDRGGATDQDLIDAGLMPAPTAGQRAGAGGETGGDGGFFSVIEDLLGQ
jgi:penicillin-binding protein 1A